MTQVTVITGVERRRTWTDDQKLELIEATLEPGANVSEIARAADIAPAQLYRWRKELLDPDPEPESGFVPVLVDDTPERLRAEPTVDIGSVAIEIEIAGAVVRIAPHAPPALVTAALQGLRA
ncbi:MULTISPECIES: IS66-like element accessory protein TnpA [Sphingomonadaceae]|jgi:transposase|uniref:IS66-like element accessory protein TnpA n=1 Tax=Sphingomonadales TaxID=204457 RepID=UPI00044E8394|nr:MULTISPECIES: transposase [Sphingomonadaceae]EZP64503.1 Transposase IS3/IS911 family protein [Sphingomonas paucimobilis]EZP67727.1 Transposase IS3/IS911 family protein [Sphingomonas paucimobilis]